MLFSHRNATNAMLQLVLSVTRPSRFDEGRIETGVYQPKGRRPMRSGEGVVIPLVEVELQDEFRIGTVIAPCPGDEELKRSLDLSW